MRQTTVAVALTLTVVAVILLLVLLWPLGRLPGHKATPSFYSGSHCTPKADGDTAAADLGDGQIYPAQSVWDHPHQPSNC